MVDENMTPEEDLESIKQESEELDEAILQNIRESEAPYVSEEIQEENDPITILEKEKAELKDAYLRLSAETDNYRKRIQQEKEAFKKIALKDIMVKLLPVVDNLERSIKAAENSDNLVSLKEGVQMVLDQFENALKDFGLEKIAINIGDEFDPQIAEAVMLEERDDVAHSMTVVDVFETGCRLGGQVLRTSKVKVAKK